MEREGGREGLERKRGGGKCREREGGTRKKKRRREMEREGGRD